MTGRRSRGDSTAIAVATANALIAWPEGNEGETGTSPTASRPMASGGRLRSTSAFSAALSHDARAKLSVAVPATSGSRRRSRRSAHQPTATSNGPLTHHAETSTRTAVAGLQRRAVVARTASWSRPTSSCSVFSMTQVTPCGRRDADQRTRRSAIAPAQVVGVVVVHVRLDVLDAHVGDRDVVPPDASGRREPVALGPRRGLPQLRAHERLRAVQVRLVGLDDDRGDRRLAPVAVALEELGVAGDRGAPVHAQGLAHAGDHEEEPDLPGRDDVADRVEAPVARLVGEHDGSRADDVAEAGDP